MATVKELEEKLKGHEDLCTERHNNIQRRLGKIEGKLDNLLSILATPQPLPEGKTFIDRLTPMKIIAISASLALLMGSIAMIATGHAPQLIGDLLGWERV